MSKGKQARIFSLKARDRPILDLSNFPIPRTFKTVLFADLIEKIDFGRKGVSLDIGCGVGVYSFMMAKLGTNVVGIDLTLDNVRASKIQTRCLKYRCDFLVADAERLPLASESVDCVVHLAVLEHLSDPSVGIEELAQALKPRGKLILYTLNRTMSPISRLHKKIFPSHYRKELHLVGHSESSVFSLKDLIELLAISGINVNRVLYYSSFVSRIFDWIIVPKIMIFARETTTKRRELMRTLIGLYNIFFFPLLRVLGKIDSLLERVGASDGIFIIGEKVLRERRNL